MIKLTDKVFWENYWNNKKDLISDVSKHNYFGKIYEKLFGIHTIKTTIEIGGFPGYQSIFIKKYYSVNTTLFDFYINKNIIEQLLLCNAINKNELTVIEGDLFEYTPVNKYDLVFSIGLVEHFEDTDKIIELHKNFLSDEGVLLIIIPNFKGINGLVQKILDRENYDKHFIPCMDLNVLKKSAESSKLNVTDISYYGKFSVWLENKNETSQMSKLIVKLIWIIGKVFFKVFPFDSKLFSPYIVMTCTKQTDHYFSIIKSGN